MRKSGRTSTEAKKRYHDKVYTDLNVALPHALYRQYRAKCATDNVSMRSKLIEMLYGFIEVNTQAELDERQAAADERLFADAIEAARRLGLRGY